MFNRNYIIFYDFECDNKYATTTHPTQLAAVAIHPGRLEIVPGSEFNSEIRIIEDQEERDKLGLGEISEEALTITGKSIAELRTAPKLDSVWTQFCEYVDSYNLKKNNYNAPIASGYNILNFDNIITDRICGPHGYNLGPWNKERQCNNLFGFVTLDLYPMVWSYFNQSAEPSRLNMDTLRDFFGYSKEFAHDALEDCRQGADLLCRFLKLQRHVCSNIQWKK